jgi:His-Xaa-Ser system radical SAM maturase HxsC
LRTLNGRPSNCHTPLLGRIVKDADEKKYKFNSILATTSPNKRANKHLAVVTNASSFDSVKVPLFLQVKRIDELKTGDVVQLSPDGTLNVLYERESSHNVLFVTEQCNCSCLMCPQPTTKVKSDLTDSVLELVKLIDPSTQTLGITGGEPTLLGDNFLRVVKCCKEYLPNTAIQVLSNGIRFSDFDFAKAFVLVGHPNIQIGIPLYSDIDTIHNHIVQANGFFETIKGMQNLALFSQNIEIRTVINALNYKRLPQIAEFIYRNFPFVVHIAFMGMETRELAMKNLEQLWIDPYDYGSYLEEAVEILTLRKMHVSIYNHQLCILSKLLWPYARKSISTWKNVYIEVCESCTQKQFCGGFFASGQDVHSKYLHAL